MYKQINKYIRFLTLTILRIKFAKTTLNDK